MENQKKQKLQIVGLHGYNTNKDVFEFQSRQFREKFGDVMDFHFFEGPHMAVDEPIQALVDRGFKPPFKSYLGLGEQLELDESKVQERVASFRVTGLDLTISDFVEFSREHGPFDGALCFPVESVHLYGKKDEYLHLMTAHTLFTKNPLVLSYEQGHQFPRALADEDFEKLKDFVRRQYVSKYGSDEGFSIEATKY
ncbi:hypothetical protein FGO68_gene3739 [Halteria grandinella]|uniref:Serine hydrolase domain-containing protein n=1 Tax=Halteria grandinella TaxID=5974 RepID=A0A8J8NJ28_HALGN|nr:hypothetical protein FGO68_gene3739 [Halteria grandinella]